MKETNWLSEGLPESGWCLLCVWPCSVLTRLWLEGSYVWACLSCWSRHNATTDMDCCHLLATSTGVCRDIVMSALCGFLIILGQLGTVVCVCIQQTGEYLQLH